MSTNWSSTAENACAQNLSDARISCDVPRYRGFKLQERARGIGAGPRLPSAFAGCSSALQLPSCPTLPKRPASITVCVCARYTRCTCCSQAGREWALAGKVEGYREGARRRSRPKQPYLGRLRRRGHRGYIEGTQRGDADGTSRVHSGYTERVHRGYIEGTQRVHSLRPRERVCAGR